MNRRTFVLLLACLATGFSSTSAWGWGADIHRTINRLAIANLPGEFRAFGQWEDSLVTLATAADDRKPDVPGESIRHYIDIDDYPEFKAGTLPHAFDDMVARYGRSRVESNGILPWAIEDSYSHLVDFFEAGDWSGAVVVAADIGHYAGDLHNPLHLTVNYDGDLTGQSGIHSRFETRLTRRHLSEFSSLPGYARVLADPLEETFKWIDQVYPGVALILAADLKARAAAGGSTSGDTYYAVLWEEVGQDTWSWVGRASMSVASLWYSAWVQAGSPAIQGKIPVEATTWSRVKVLFSAAAR